jgi:hypothetical protein
MCGSTTVKNRASPSGVTSTSPSYYARINLSWILSLFLRQRRFRGSPSYWQSRYEAGGSSGAGSSGFAAEYKATIVNDIIAQNSIGSVIEFGCGDGIQLSLGEYPKYIGLDVSSSAVRLCAKRFSEDHSKSFFLYDPNCFHDRQGVFHADTALSLDVIYHLVEDSIFHLHMKHLFASADRHVVIYSSDHSSDTHSPDPEPHVRHRPFSRWVEEHQPQWELTQQFPGAGESSPLSFFIYALRQ